MKKRQRQVVRMRRLRYGGANLMARASHHAIFDRRRAIDRHWHLGRERQISAAPAFASALPACSGICRPAHRQPVAAPRGLRLWTRIIAETGFRRRQPHPQQPISTGRQKQMPHNVSKSARACPRVASQCAGIDFEKEKSPRVGRVMRSKRDCFLVSVWKE